MILVIGQSGQIARAFSRKLKGPTEFWGHAVLGDLSTPEQFTSLQKKLRETKPSLVINTAAYTAVDKAETEREACHHLNVQLPATLAAYASANGIPLIHYSSDYVYPGSGTNPQSEDTKTGPLNYYGESKLRGDEEIAKCGGPHLILRTSWVYSFEGQNFLKTMLRLGGEREQLKIVSDQWGAPSAADDLAQMTLQMIEQNNSNWKSGVFHLTNSGATSWFEFAREIFQLAELRKPLKVKEVLPISTSDYPTPACRPLNSRLSLEKLRSHFGVSPRSWKEALSEVLSKTTF